MTLDVRLCGLAYAFVQARFNRRQTLSRGDAPTTDMTEAGHVKGDSILPTYVSIVNWSGRRQPRIDDVRRAIALRSPHLRRRGMHSLAFLPDEGACTGIMVSTCTDEREAERIAASILPTADVRVESMMFEDEPRVPAWIARDATMPPTPRDFRRALLKAIVSDS
jgi:hypothetical protein